jgi:hypothetical protein
MKEEHKENCAKNKDNLFFNGMFIGKIIGSYCHSGFTSGRNGSSESERVVGRKMAARGKYQRKLNRLYDSIIMRQPNTGQSRIGTLSGSGATGSGSSTLSGSGATGSTASGCGSRTSGSDTTGFAASQMIDDIIAKWPDVKIIDFDQNE